MLKKTAAICAFFFLVVISSVFCESASLPNGYGKLQLGMSVDDTKSVLKSIPDFGYRGDRDASISPSSKETIIETSAARVAGSFFDRCWFQFHKGNLYIITLNLNQSRVDYFSIFKTFCEKYGEPNSLSPDKSVWSNDNVTMSLEKPLTIKYVDVKAFSDLQNSSKVDKTVEENNREKFLKSL